MSGYARLAVRNGLFKDVRSRFGGSLRYVVVVVVCALRRYVSEFGQLDYFVSGFYIRCNC